MSKPTLWWNVKPDDNYYLLPTILVNKQNDGIMVCIIWLWYLIGFEL